jgi:hypothetical protein
MCRGYFSSQEIDSHHATEHRSTDQSRNGCRMCCLPRQPFEITQAKKIIVKILLSNIHAKTLKLWKHSAMRLATSRTNAADQFTNRALMNSVCPPRCPLHSPGLTCMRACASPRAGAASTIEIATNIHPHSTRCTAGCHTSRDFVHWRFSDAGRRSAWIASSCRRPKTYTQERKSCRHAPPRQGILVLAKGRRGSRHRPGVIWHRS